jgi:hypothetical protein
LIASNQRIYLVSFSILPPHSVPEFENPVFPKHSVVTCESH